MSFSVNPAGSQPQVVSLPQMQRIVQDVIDCVQQLKEDFSSSKSPITDDSQVLQRFCAKLEHLLQYEMKERFTLLGKRKDYWDYFCDCLASNKGANDGIKYVKALGEHKTSLGKGRAFLRFSLVHQRLADTLQQCSIHTKTGEWYNQGSVWLSQDVSSPIINTLYDLNGLHFDLSPRGYDLDNAWPSFARYYVDRYVPGGGNWNVPASRRSSITSMDTLSLRSTDPSELNRLQQELASAETARSVLAENVTTLEQERQRAEQSVWMTQGELTALQEQLKSTGKNLEELRQKYSALELSHTQLKADQGKEVDRRSAELSVQQQQLSQEKEQLTQQQAALTQQTEKERAHFTGEIQTLRQNLIEVTDARDKLTSKVTSLEEGLEQARAWEAKREQQILRLEQSAVSLEQRNKELLDEVSRSLASRQQEATSQLDSAQKFQDLLSKLKDAEAENVRLQGSQVDLTHQRDLSHKAAEEERAKRDDLESKLTAETEKSHSLSSELNALRTELESERATGTTTVEKLETQIAEVQVESDRTKAELSLATETLENTKSRQSDLVSFISQLTQVALDSSGGGDVDTPDISSCSESDMTQFVQTCRQSAKVRFSDLRSRLEAVEKKETALSAERDTMLRTLDAVCNVLPDKPDNSPQELPQRVQEVETRVKSLCTKLSDLTTNNDFLKQQLHLAQGEHSDKGNQLSHLEGRLLELEKVLKESRSSESRLQGQVASMELTLKTTQQHNADLQSQLQTTGADLGARSQECQDLQREKESLEKQTRELQTQVSDLMTSVSAEAEERKKEEESLNRKAEELESALEGALGELEEKRSQLSNMQVKVREGEETVEKFLASMASLETDKASIVTEHDGLQQQLTDLTSQLNSALADKQQQESANETLQRELEQLSQRCATLTEELERKESEVKSSLESSQKSTQEHADTVHELKSQLENAQSEMSQEKKRAEETLDKLSQEMSLRASAEAERDGTTQKLEQLSLELTEKEATFSEQVQSLRAQLQTFQTEKEELRKSSSSSQEEMTKLLTDKQDLMSSLQQEKATLEKRLNDMSEQKQTSEAEAARLLPELEEAKKAAESNQAKLKQELEQMQSRLRSDNDSFKQQVSELTQEVDRAKKDLTAKMEELEEAREQIEAIRNETERLCSGSASEKLELEDSLEKLEWRFSELQTAMDAMLKEKEELTSLQAVSQEEILELKADLASSGDGYNFLLQSSQKVAEEKDSEIEVLKSLLNSKEHEVEGALAEKTKEAADLTEQVKTLSSAMAVLEEEDRARREEVTQLEKALHDTTQVESLEQEVSALQFQLSSEQLQHQEFLRRKGEHETSATEMSSQLADQQALIADLEKELSSKEADYETKRTNLNQQVEELKGALKAKEKECGVLADQLQKTSDKLAESSTSAEFFQKENSSLRVSLDHDLEEREEEIRSLRSDNDLLKTKLVKAIKDKAALWQQTDALAYEHKRKAEGKWLDSNAVAKCMGCQADFSLFLRKHHCRQCGGIFCHDCSNNWVGSTSSSRKSRACAQCHSDLQKLDASVAKASLLPDDSDDDSGNVGSDATTTTTSSSPPPPLGSQVDDSQSQSSLVPERTLDATAGAGNQNGQTSPGSSGDDLYARNADSPEPSEPPPAPSQSGGQESTSSQDGSFQVITQEEVSKSVAAYDEGSTAGPLSLIDVPNMSSSMLLSADDLASGEINKQSDTWIKPGHSFAVPIAISTPNTVVCWEFTVHPKDIDFSITYHEDRQQPVSQAEVLVPPARYNSLQEPIRGELTARQAGVYTLLFDNAYSRMTSKKIHYSLNYNS